ncbi:UNVERIFIED_CONTAM: hypothetical protein GTU68_031417 [Idotea baltica]|nr:hypothetical protein [Idotea baltica]
MHIYFQRSFI